jgi:hypothetical protein
VLGEPNQPRLKVKAAECYGFLICLLDMMRKYAGPVGDVGATMVQCGDAIVRYISVLKGEGDESLAGHHTGLIAEPAQHTRTHTNTH